MRRSNWLHELRASLGHSKKSYAHSAKWRPTAARRPKFEPLEERNLLAVLTVNSALDNNTFGNGLVTLREAIIAANANTTTDLGQTGSGADTIQFDSTKFATPKTLSLIFGEMVVSEALTINGPGRDALTVDAQLNSRIFKFTATTGDFTVTDLSLTRGRSVGTSYARGGALYKSGSGDLNLARVSITGSSVIAGNNSFNNARGGGIFIEGRTSRLTISSSTISGNTAMATIAHGGGIASFAKFVTITDSFISDNSAIGPQGSGGGVNAYNDQFTSSPELTLTGTTITGNSSTVSGGGVFINGGLIVGGRITDNRTTRIAADNSGGGGGVFSNVGLTVRDATIHANHSTTEGGGIKADFTTLTIESSTVSGNSSQGRGGGVAAGSALSITSSTISGNIAAGDGGGTVNGSWVSLTHSTVTNNHSTRGQTGGVMARFIDIRSFSSIVAGNTAANGNPDLSSGNNTFTIRYTLVGDAAGTALVQSHTPDANGNLIGNSAGAGVIDAKLGPLTDNGGPTSAHALLVGSPAIDANPYHAPSPSHNYPLGFFLADTLGGPSLTAEGGALMGSGYKFGASQGLTLSSALPNPAQYSLEILFRWDATPGGWHKIIDFHNLASNVGLYTANSGLHFLNGPFAANLFSPNTLARLVLTRDDTTDTVRGYINGVEVWNFIDVSSDAVFDGPNQIIRFFQDDNITAQSEAQAGFVEMIRIYNSVLTAPQVAFLESPIAIPAFDQRGTPFARVRDGDGIGGAQLDIGAFERQDPPSVMQMDYGDAPDATAGSGPKNFNTRSADNGPSHAIIAGLRMGASVDGDDGTLQNSAANADDVDGALPDDEDGLNNPAADLVLTVSAQPTVNVRVTNTTGSSAMLYGWIDYNANGVFDNVTERASVAVPTGTNNSVVTLTFPAVPTGFTGTTYARFRLSTDIAAANATGSASDGEVEDYRVSISLPGTATADTAKNTKIASAQNGGPALADGDKFGSAVTAIGDLDGDGVGDLVVGAPVRFGVPSAGNVHILFMNANGTVKTSQRIGNGVGGGPALSNGDYFGHSVAALGDLNGDGVTDLAVGASKDDTGGYINGAVYVLFMNTSGTVQASQKIATGVGGGPALATSDRFGAALAAVGDFDGDGVGDLAVGASGDDTGGNYRGAVHILFLNPNGTVKSSEKIAHGVGGGPALANLDFFGGAVANLGDLDGDGHTELAVGASGDDTNGSGRGAVHVLFLNANGTVKTIRKIASGTNGGPALSDDDAFGRAVASVGDLDGDGVTDLAVGAYRDDTDGGGRGAVHVLLLNSDGTVKTSQKIASGLGGGPTLANDDRFGSGVASLGDLDGDGRIDLAVGAETDDTGGDSRGAVHVLFLTAANTAPVFTSPDSASVPENTASVLTVTAIDANAPPQTVTFSIVGGVDQSKFSITSGGALSFVTPPNYEVPTDANGDNVYIVIVQASDGSLTTLQAIVVTVSPVNDNIPVFLSPAAVTVFEGATTVMNLLATDADLPPQVVTFFIAGGADQSKFNITSGNMLRFNSPPNFEAPTDANGDNIYEVVVAASDGNGAFTNQTILVTVASLRDFGDAPDATPGTVPGSYNTRFADNGPRHMIVPGLRLGASVDGDPGFLENPAANADDVDSALPDDEDGTTNPAADLSFTIGAQPTVNMRVTNTTGAAATLYGWIDYNANGVFDNGTERGSVPVPNGTNNGIVTLVFPTVPPGYFGNTYARFRLSTDVAAANSVGSAGDGEVEDYRANIIKPSELTAESTKTHQIDRNSGDPLNLGSFDHIGSSLANIGDVDGDGVTDLAVGGSVRRNVGINTGTVFIFFMNPDGTVRSSQQISSGIGGGPVFDIQSDFGYSVAPLGDLDGDGVPDLAVGATRPSSPPNGGEVRVLFLNANGTVKRSTLIGNGVGGGPPLANLDLFGASVTSIGDLDGDGISDLAVGARDNDYRGGVYVLFMNADGTVKNNQKIASGVGGGPTFDHEANFGASLTSLGDMDGDGITELAVGEPGDRNLPISFGAVHVLRLNTNGTVKSSTKIASGIGGGPILANHDRFGDALAALGDVDGDGVMDLAVSASGDDLGFDPNDPYTRDRGALYMMLLNSDGTVKRHQKISQDIGGGPPNLIARAFFGRSIAALGDLDRDGLTDIAVGAHVQNVIIPPGAVFILFLQPANLPPFFTSPQTASVVENTSNIMTVAASDPDGHSVTFSIVGGADQSRFAITAGGSLSFVTTPNFEAPTDANADNVYVVTVQADDGNFGTTTQTISVTVTPINEHAPVFTLPDVVNVPENSTAVLSLTATDADLPPQVVTFSIAGGADQSKFSVTSGGALSFISPPDFEAPTDANGDNVYVVIVQASDGSLTNLHALFVSVTNVNEVPTNLAGDYNNNGTVDAADYVVWRKALGTSIVLPNDTTPGSVTQPDYNVWRTNFGRSVPGSAASTVEVVAQAVGRNEEAFVVPALAGSDRLQPELRTRDGRPVAFRSTRRDAMVAPSLRDRALQAWLTSRSEVAPLDDDSVGDDEYPHHRANQDRDETVDALDMAFAAL